MNLPQKMGQKDAKILGVFGTRSTPIDQCSFDHFPHRRCAGFARGLDGRNTLVQRLAVSPRERGRGTHTAISIGPAWEI